MTESSSPARTDAGFVRQPPRDATVVAGIGDLHPPPALPAAHDALQQADALARGAAALAGLNHVAAQRLARGEVVVPADIAGMVLGDADGPLLDRQFHGPPARPPVVVQSLVGAGAAEHERARIDRVGEEVVDGAIARAGPAHPPLTDAPARQLLVLGDQLTHDL